MKFTNEEKSQIRDYQQHLRSSVRLQQHAREQHRQDIRTVEAWYGFGEPSEYGREVCARLNRRMEARRITFERLELPLEEVK